MRKKAHLALARAAKKMKLAEACESTDVGEVQEHVLHGGGDADFDVQADNVLQADNIRITQSASATKLQKFQAHNGGDNANVLQSDSDRVWTFVEMGQLNSLISSVLCPECQQNSVSLILGNAKMGFSREMTLSCTNCGELKCVHTSPRIGRSADQNVGFEVNRLAVLYTHEIGGGFRSLSKLSAVFGMPGLHEKTFYNLNQKICQKIQETGEATLDVTADIVKQEYLSVYPNGRPVADVDEEWEEEEEDVPWIDVSFDGTWQKRGFTSHYGVGIAIDVLTGYVIDFEVLSTYCHTCAINRAKLEQMTDAERQEWEQNHQPNCCINHEGSSKSMEREAALRLWGR